MKNCQCLCFTGVRRDCEIHNEILKPQQKKINRINFHFPREKKNLMDRIYPKGNELQWSRTFNNATVQQAGGTRLLNAFTKIRCDSYYTFSQS